MSGKGNVCNEKNKAMKKGEEALDYDYWRDNIPNRSPSKSKPHIVMEGEPRALAYSTKPLSTCIYTYMSSLRYFLSNLITRESPF